MAQIQGQEKEGFTIKSIVVNNSEFAEVKGSKPNFSITIKKQGSFTADIVVEREGFIDLIFHNCEFEIRYTSIQISRIDILKFPAYKNDGSSWDLKYWGQSSSVRNPDLVWQIEEGDTILFKLAGSKKHSNAEQSKMYYWTFGSSPITIKKGTSYEFHLHDYDSTSRNDYMGGLYFFVPSDYATSKIFKSTNDKIQIKVYFTYL